MDTLKRVKLKTLFLIGIITYAAYAASIWLGPDARASGALRVAYRLATSLPFALFLAWLFIRLERPPLVRWGVLGMLIGRCASLLFGICLALMMKGTGEGARMLIRVFYVAQSVSGGVYLAGLLVMALPFLRHPEPSVYWPAIVTVICTVFCGVIMLLGTGFNPVGRIWTFVLTYAPFFTMLVCLYIAQIRMERERKAEYDG